MPVVLGLGVAEKNVGTLAEELNEADDDFEEDGAMTELREEEPTTELTELNETADDLDDEDGALTELREEEPITELTGLDETDADFEEDDTLTELPREELITDEALADRADELAGSITSTEVVCVGAP